MSPALRFVLGCVLIGLLHTSLAESPRVSSFKIAGDSISVVHHDGKFPATGMTHLALFAEESVQVTGFYGFNERDESLPIERIDFWKVIGGRGFPIEDACSGSHHSLVLVKGGAMRSWGLNTYGTVGYGKIAAYEVQEARNVSLQGLPTDAKVVAIACGAYNSFALTDKGNVYAWGYGRWGMNGRGSIRDKPFPMAIARSGLALQETIMNITAGFHHVLARTSLGRVLCWGDNTHKPCGPVSTKNGTRHILHKPHSIGVPRGFNFHQLREIAAGNGFTLFLMEDGSVWGQGRNDKSQLASKASATPSRLVKLNIPKATQIHASHSSGFAMLESGSAITWGSRHYALGPQKPGESPYVESPTDLSEFNIVGFPKHDSKGHHIAFFADKLETQN